METMILILRESLPVILLYTTLFRRENIVVKASCLVGEVVEHALRVQHEEAALPFPPQVAAPLAQVPLNFSFLKLKFYTA